MPLKKINLPGVKCKVFIRTDGGHDLGLGHVSRMISLAHFLRSDFKIHFLVKSSSPGAKIQIINEQFELSEIPSEILLIEEPRYFLTYLDVGNQPIFVLDHYLLTLQYQQELKRSINCSIVYIDDFYQNPFLADVIINFTGSYSTSRYTNFQVCEYYLGLKYVLLNPDFSSPFLKSYDATKSNLMISLGASDAHNYTMKTLASITTNKSIDQVVIHIVLGAEYAHYGELDDFIVSSKLRCVKHFNLKSREMADLMNACFFSIVPPSTTSYEFISTGGVCFLVMTAANQVDVEAFLLKSRLASSFEEFKSFDFGSVIPRKFDSLLKVQNDAISGNNRSVVSSIFLHLSFEQFVKIESARPEDCEKFFEWANDPEVRANAFLPQAISFPDHFAWFHNKLLQEHEHLFVLKFNGSSLGQVRFEETSNGNVMLHYSIGRDWRGNGLGRKIVKLGMRTFLSNKQYPVKFIARVKPENLFSCRVFETLGFSIIAAENNHIRNSSVNYTLTTI